AECAVAPSCFRTHACILTRVASTTRSLGYFPPHTTLPYPPTHLDQPPKSGRPSHMCECHGFGGVLSPAKLSAQNHLTSELLRTLSRMAASKPTSWLSMQLHILSHSAHP